MTNLELIERLRTLPPDLEVYLEDWRDGAVLIREVDVVIHAPESDDDVQDIIVLSQ